MPEVGLIYKHTNKINGKAYVGKTTKSVSLRKKKQYYSHFKNALEKYGWNNFETTVIEDNIPVDSLDEREIYWIAELGTFKEGYNSTEGGGGSIGWNHSQESKNLISRKRLGTKQPESFYERRAETIQNMPKVKRDKWIAKVSKSVVQFSKTGKLIKEHKSIISASRETGVNDSDISKCTRGKRNSAGGFYWLLKEDLNNA